jgi:hypothetical protein
MICGIATVVLALVGSSGAARAADVDQRFALKGASRVTCGQFVKLRAEKPELAPLFNSWMDGYLTALNEKLPETYDLMLFENSELLNRLVEANCKRKPEERYFVVVRALVRVMQQTRLTAHSPRTEISVGDSKTALYAETVTRMQRRLSEAGYFTGQPLGVFDEPTREAIKEFQTANGFEATGFPDVRTLLKVFRQSSKPAAVGDAPSPEQMEKKPDASKG